MKRGEQGSERRQQAQRSPRRNKHGAQRSSVASRALNDTMTIQGHSAPSSMYVYLGVSVDRERSSLTFN